MPLGMVAGMLEVRRRYAGYMRAMTRRIETQQVEVSGYGLPEIQERLTAATPAGFDLVSAPVAMQKASTEITAKATFERRDETREIENANMDELRAATPEGWQLMYVL